MYASDKIIRLPLGAFINHREIPNCKRVTCGKFWHLVTIKDIVEGEELTLYYNFYSV